VVIAADGGAAKAALLGLRPDVIVGDLDSLAPDTLERLRAEGVEICAYPAEKEESDTQLALREAIARGASRLIIAGGLGGLRLDHTLANLLLLALPELAGHEVVLLDGAASVRVLGLSGPDELSLEGTPGDLVSLLPLSERVRGVETEELAYPLRGETLEQGYSRGLSNVMQAGRATIRTAQGRLAVVHTPAGAGGPSDA
jgi:thiamine pyrophosphokinase